ncbi:uncharacterized protein MYCFIDRAFT_207482 [Pseudocercospora fijiensis CIRAD86]|uniref:Uncharacterized protein n=1 Tax=Pseudocercospora fijiensis (strain CIRAD86) TaxID=383855 RepID=M2Z5J2_PSEFD|nr:uncharacterized protein MYCFIDRAFT_207482 [Pseudocercospora fijiensis CIRAD86]EME85085.1 hypothetical protein MYCFIDRAFT_207482 [Pseudocercospora fijiensis CIRAD86]
MLMLSVLCCAGNASHYPWNIPNKTPCPAFHPYAIHLSYVKDNLTRMMQIESMLHNEVMLHLRQPYCHDADSWMLFLVGIWANAVMLILGC